MKVQRLIQVIIHLPQNLLRFILHIPKYSKITVSELIIFGSFFSILILTLLGVGVRFIMRFPLFKKLLLPILAPIGRLLQKFSDVLIDKFEALRPFKIKRRYLVFVAMQNLKMRKSRSFITIFGMSVGVGIIVLLLSLGYGIERLVIRQIASLNELKMIDVSAGESSKASLTNDALKQMKEIEHVQELIPLISVVGRLNYKNAKTDILVHAVPKQYFELARLDMMHGTYFKDALDFNVSKVSSSVDVAGASNFVVKARFGNRVSQDAVAVRILPLEEVPVYAACEIDSGVLGFASRSEGSMRAVELYGDEYAPFSPDGRVAFDDVRGEYLGSWFKGEFEFLPQLPTGSLENKKVQAEWKVGCIPRKYLQVVENIQVTKADVLGDATGSAELALETTETVSDNEVSSLIDSFFGLEVATDSAIFNDLDSATGSGALEIVYSSTRPEDDKKEQTLEFSKPVSGSAVASSGLLRLLGVDPAKYKNESINVSFIIIRSLLPEISGRVLTSEEVYKVVGVVEDDEAQFIYIPIQDMNILGITNYSQVKVQVDNERNMASIRESIESMGYKTASTGDTVAEVEAFFAGLRNILGFLGFIALGVASLGMFNTLTVSLLERSREIGGMKTMGMVSGEIQELFLAEAMIMGFGGGLGGLVLGAVIGKLISYSVSIVAITQGVGYLDLTFIPISLVIFIITCSFVVGVITGLYPAYRAKKISALNALRYE